MDDNGWIVSVANEVGSRTCYGYDAMGRISSITYPSETAAGVCDATAWEPTRRDFVPVSSEEYGIAAGHWRLTESTGNAVKITYFDGLWRPLLVREYDAADRVGTERFTRTAYDAEGRTTFQSYPSNSSAPSTGIWTEYDALGRVTAVAQDSELGVLVSTTEYLPGFQTRTTNPRGYQTVSSFMAYDQPGTEWPLRINAPEGQTTILARDPFGKPLAITRGGVTRSYGYDGYQQLCRKLPRQADISKVEHLAGWLRYSIGVMPSRASCSRCSL